MVPQKWKKWEKRKKKIARPFLTIFKQKWSYLRPLLFITFPQGFRISKNIRHPTSGSEGKKTVKRYLKSKKSERKKLFLRGDFRQYFIQKCSHLRPFLSITFLQGFRISKNIGHPISGSGGKRTVKRYLKSKKKVMKKTFFCAVILDSFQTKMFIFETTSFHYVSPRIPNL